MPDSLVPASLPGRFATKVSRPVMRTAGKPAASAASTVARTVSATSRGEVCRSLGTMVNRPSRSGPATDEAVGEELGGDLPQLLVAHRDRDGMVDGPAVLDRCRHHASPGRADQSIWVGHQG